jgi:hypothetical protein
MNRWHVMGADPTAVARGRPSRHGPNSGASGATESPDGLCGRRWTACGRRLRRWGTCHGRRIMGNVGVQQRRSDGSGSSTSITARCTTYLACGRRRSNCVRSRREEKTPTHLAMGGHCGGVPAHRSSHDAVHRAHHPVPLLTSATCRYLHGLSAPYRRTSGLGATGGAAARYRRGRFASVGRWSHVVGQVEVRSQAVDVEGYPLLFGTNDPRRHIRNDH